MSSNETSPNELNQMVPAGLKWLAEMEALNSPVLLNVIYGNIYCYPNIKDAEILIDRNNRKMLVLIQFSWIVRKIFKKRKKETILNILDQLQELLPSFEFRVIEDRQLFDLSVKRMTEFVTGGENNVTDDKADTNGNDSSDSTNTEAVGGSTKSTSGMSAGAKAEGANKTGKADSKKPS